MQTEDSSSDEQSEHDSGSNTSDVSDDSSDEEDEQVASTAETSHANEEDEEEEDEVIQAIRRENERQRDHPPTITCDEFIVDISFHPREDILAVANIVGDAVIYKYTLEENTVANRLELHTKAVRDIEFGPDGKVLYSAAKDKAIMLSDVETGKLVHYVENAHDVAPYCITVLDDNMFATGTLLLLLLLF